MKVAVNRSTFPTLTPMSFGAFAIVWKRHRGSVVQFREVEFVPGYKRKDMLRFHKEGTPEYGRLLHRLHEASVVDCFYVFLEGRGVTIPAALRERDPTEPAVADETVEAGVLRLYRTQPEMEILFELMTDFDEGFQEWRYRHIKLVERTIGSKAGTGGSLGVEFLKKSLFRPVFADLWGIRHKL
jgi:tryptophan 2,3-dioxygenase